MPTLDKTLRAQLERDIKKARGIAETAARAALEQLGVGEAAPFEYLSEEERVLRRKLRAHGRQLGDPLHSDKVQALDLLIEEVAMSTGTGCFLPASWPKTTSSCIPIRMSPCQ